jgi:phenylalanyl-tRNA synthetase beta chain
LEIPQLHVKSRALETGENRIMKFTLSWLKEHLDTDAALDEIITKLTAIGLEVESVEDRAKAFAAFKVAYVEKADKHPDADRLRVCIVDTGKEKLQVVCGAPNARTGMKAVFAPAGSFIPGTQMELKKGVIRGQESNGMLVSEREMGLSDEHAGIIDVPDSVPVGTAFASLYGLDDPVIEINLTPNRADCAGVRGIARDLAASGLGKLKPLDESAVKGGFKSSIGVDLKFDGKAKNACPLFIGRYIKGVKNGPSPDWLQRRLKAIGLRPISALVDITNYLTYDLCRPLHVFDADKIKGSIHVRLAKKGEKLEALDGKTYELDDFMTAVCDEAGVQGLGGVIGGAATGCEAGTVNVYLECAYFDPYRTAKTGRALQINSDARYRFERGIDPAFTVPAAEIATRLILSLCGGAAGEVVVAGAVPSWQRTISYDPAYLKQLAGFTVDEKIQKNILESLGFALNTSPSQREGAGGGVQVQNSGTTTPHPNPPLLGEGIWSVQPPSWRADVEGRADIVEEIVRINGYDAIPPVSVTKDGAITHSAETPGIARARKVRTALAGRGMNECVTWSFMPHERAEKFGANDRQSAAALRLANPISADLDQMRPSILPNLIEAAGKNRARGFADTALFEVGPVFSSPRIDGHVIAAAGIRSGQAGPRHWSGPDASRPDDTFDAKADALAALEACGVSAAGLQIAREAPAWFHPGRSGVFRQGPAVLAHFGEIHPAVLADLDIKGPVTGFEVFLDRVPAQKKKGTAKKLLVLPSFQPIERDFAFIVDKKVEAEALIRAVKSADKDLIARVEVFDVYSGPGIEEGQKSVALSVVIQPVQKTLTDAEIEALSAKIVSAAAAKTAARLRS